MPGTSPESLIVAVVGATGAVGRTMIQVLLEKPLPDRASCGSSPRSARRAGRMPSAAPSSRWAWRRRRRSRASTSRCSAPAAAPRRTLAPEAAAARRGGHRQLERVAHGPRRAARRVARSTPTTSRGTRASSPTPTARRCSSCRRSWRSATRSASSGSSSTPTRRSPGTATRRSSSSRSRSRPTPRAARRSRASTRTRSRSTPCPTSTCSSTTGTRRRSGRSSRRAARSSTCRTSGSRARPSGCRCSSATPRRSTSRRATRSRRSEARALFAAVKGVVVQDDPAANLYPLATEAAGSDDVFVGRVRQDPSIDGNRGLAFWVVCDNLRKGAASNAVELAEVLVARGWIRKASDAARQRAAWGRPGDGPRDARRAPGGARGHRERGPGVHALPAARGADARRPGRGRPRHRGRVRRRGPGLQRGPRGPAVRRPGRRAARPAAGEHRLAARGRVHHERREVPAARQPRPAARRDRRLRAVPAAPARGRSTPRSS